MANDKHLAILKKGVRAWNRWRYANEEEANLREANLAERNLSGANFYGAYLVGANLSGANLEEADLTGANLWYARLSHANLVRADMAYAHLYDAKLCGADLTGANLIRARLNDADLNKADLTNADLTHADLDGANLENANFTGVNFVHADLSHANLNGANFKNAQAWFTKFTECDLSQTKGLALIKHAGPSTIGIDTIYASKGEIPESFLRGCGVPEGFITEMRSLLNTVEGLQFYSCFISYSCKDEDFAKRLHGKMRDAHLRVWFAPEDIQGGKKLHEQIETAIRVYDKLLIVLSEASLKSEWVMTELRNARKAERKSGKRKLFPVRLVDFKTLCDWESVDADSGKDLAVELREYFIPDFSNWKNPDQFEAAFARLLKDLRAV